MTESSPVDRLADHLETVGELDDHPGDCPERFLVIDDEHAYGHLFLAGGYRERVACRH